MIIVDLFRVVAVTARNQDPLVWQIDLVDVTHRYLNFTEQLPEGIYDICDLEIARCDLVKHRREQEKVISANETNLYRLHSRQQLLKMNGGINPSKTAAQNDDSLFARPASYPSDHRVLSLAELPVRRRREPCRSR